jgi:hypothetical protein
VKERKPRKYSERASERARGDLIFIDSARLSIASLLLQNRSFFFGLIFLFLDQRIGLGLGLGLGLSSGVSGKGQISFASSPFFFFFFSESFLFFHHRVMWV